MEIALAVLFVLLWLVLHRQIASLRRENEIREQLLQSLIRRVYELERAATHELPPAAAPVTPPPAIETPPPLPPPVPGPVTSAPLPVARDWEALVGGNLLNKLGALVLVV